MAALANIPQPTATPNAGAGRIDLSWTAASGPAGTIAGYNVYRSTDGTTWGSPLNGGTPVSGTAYNDTSGTSGATYYYATKIVFTGGVESTYRSVKAGPVTYPAAPPVISVAPASLTFNAVAGGSNPASQNLNITNTGGGTLTVSNATKTNAWLTLNPTSGTAPFSIAASINIVGLTAGTYNDTINITSNGGNKAVPVTLNITATPQPTITRNPTSFDLTVTLGQNLTNQTFTVGNSGTGTLNYTITKTDASSLISNINPASGSILSGGANQTITLTFSTAALAVGNYSATITITDATATNNPQTIPVTVHVTAATLSSIAVTPANPTINVGANQQFIATGTYSDSSTQNITTQVTWTSGTPATATINTSGLATGVAAGSSQISAALLGKTGTATLNVSSVATNSLTLTSPKTGDIIYGGSAVKLYWTSTGTIANIKIELSPDGGSTWGAFGATVPNTGSFESSMTWANTTEAITTMQLRISDATNPATSSTSGNFTLAPAVTPTAIVIDDFEGGSVGTWQAPNDKSGYYAFGNGMITPDKDHITADGPAAAAAKNGAKGMKVQYSYVHNADPNKDWGDGWGAKLIKTLDLTALKSVTMNVNWDGSSNNINFSLKDSDGTAMAANVSNATLLALGGYNKVSIARSAFAYDAGGSDTGANNTFDWTKVASYNFVYNTKGTTANAQNIDDITAVLTDEAVLPPPPATGEAPAITTISPTAAPAGTMITVTGVRFGTPQGGSHLDFENQTTKVSYQAQITAWSDTSITAYVPKLAATGTYEVKVVRVAIAAGTGTITALQSNPANFQVTASGAGDLAIIWPNPFNPNSQTVSIAVTDTAGASRLGFYIFDMTAKLVYKEVITSGNQISWDGHDQAGAIVADGAYLLRAINDETKSLLAKGKILVIKH
ncbi:MAG: Ig-like domain-containing protein [Candidatus Margulisiibacteriota bacterium]